MHAFVIMGHLLSHTCENIDILNSTSGVIIIIRYNIITWWLGVKNNK